MFAARNKQGRVKKGRVNKTKQPPKGKKENTAAIHTRERICMYIHIQYISVYTHTHTQYILATDSKDGGISPSPKELHSAVPLQG